MKFAILQRGDHPWLCFKHETLGKAFRPLFSLNRAEEDALRIYGFGVIKNGLSGQSVVREQEAGRPAYLSAEENPDDPGMWVITLYPGQVLGQVPADMAALLATTSEVEFSEGVTPTKVLLTRADGLDKEAEVLEAKAAELRAEAHAIREKHKDTSEPETLTL